MLRPLLEQIQKLMVHIETMNWTELLRQFSLQFVSTPDHPGPNEHPHSALLPPNKLSPVFLCVL